MKSDIAIAQSTVMKKIGDVAQELGLTTDEIEQYGHYKAKVSLKVWERIQDNPDGKLVLVTAINPTPAGEGKTTTTIGLGDALRRLGKKVVIALREPSLGPCFGVKGGAAGGGYSQVVPMEDINLHFTGDIHAVSIAHNLLAALIDNHIHQGNELNMDPRRITWGRVVDLNDRALRNVVIGLGGKADGVPRETSFDIAVASEIMAILCLANDLDDLKRRIGSIIVGYTYAGKPVTVNDLGVAGAIAVLLKEAIKPNLVQTLEHTPVLIHGGPFANIAHGCNSVTATKFGLKLGGIVVTEAGFGADLGAEKFFDIKCRFAGLKPSAAVIVATVRALKMHGGVQKEDLAAENLPALATGMENLAKHIENVRSFGVPVVVAINAFPTDTAAELAMVEELCRNLGVEAAVSEVWAKGGAGGQILAEKVLRIMEQPDHFRFLYDLELPIKEKIAAIATGIYGAEDVQYSSSAEKAIQELTALGYGQIPVCMAKTQYSFSDDMNKRGRPRGFTITVREVKVSAGANFIVAKTGEIMTMPGLPRRPAAEKIDIDSNGNISGLF